MKENAGEELFRVKVIQSEDAILEQENLHPGTYDKQAAAYDKLISNNLYNRLMWGNSVRDYQRFLEQALQRHNEGLMADIGCGTLGFTAAPYAAHQGGTIYLSDLSREMLLIGKERLQKMKSSLDNFVFLRADAFDLPFSDQAIGTLFCFGIYHIFPDPEKLLRELHRVLQAGGELLLTSLCTDRKFSARYLGFLEKKGHVATVQRSEEIIATVVREGFEIRESKVRGGMLYLTLKRI